MSQKLEPATMSHNRVPTCVLSVRYVRILGNMVHAIQIKTKLCQLVEVMMERRDDLSFCQEMKFRSVMVSKSTHITDRATSMTLHVSMRHSCLCNSVCARS